jgi:HAD superfamily hydrolase (TIGR01509 family)
VTLPELVRGVRLLGLDAGNTVIFLDHARIAAWSTANGFPTTAAALIRGEGEAKKLQERGALTQTEWEGREEPGARGWGGMIGTMIEVAGYPKDSLGPLLARLWQEHARHNLYSLVPAGLGPALDALRASGVKVAVISNSEGMLEDLFETLGIRDYFDLVVDSAKFGIEKPDVRIFQRALDAFSVRPEDALHLGDSIATDIEGARAAGMRAALIDPYGQCEGRALDVPRVSGVVEVAEAIVMENGPVSAKTA